MKLVINRTKKSSMLEKKKKKLHDFWKYDKKKFCMFSKKCEEKRGYMVVCVMTARKKKPKKKNIYIYIYMCVCVCVCVAKKNLFGIILDIV